MNILTVVTSLQKGGAEQVAAMLCNGWLRQGNDVSVAMVLTAPRAAGLDPRIPVTPLDHGGAAASAAARVWNNYGALTRLRREIRARAPDVIVSHADRTNVLTLIAARPSPVPVVAVEHVDPRVHPIGRTWDTLRRFTYPHAARLVGVSGGVASALAAAWGSGRTRTIFNPVALPASMPRPRYGEGRVVAMGRLTRQKGFDILIDAFAAISRDRPGATLTIWGEGEERARLTDQAARLGLGDRARLPGFTDDPGAALADGSLFVLSSRYEGFGLALAEAMALGLPVVAADCPSGPSDLVRHEIDGLLVPAGDPRALAAAMVRLLDDDALARSLADRAIQVRERFSLDAALGAWQQLFDELGLPHDRERPP